MKLCPLRDRFQNRHAVPVAKSLGGVPISGTAQGKPTEGEVVALTTARGNR